jgi:hypothetical protein
MSLEKNRNKILFQPLIILALFLFNQPLFSQNSSVQDTTIKVSRGSYLQSRYIKKFLQHDTLINVSRAMVPSVQLGGDRTIAFYDSLKSIASKTILTQALYDLVIVSPDSAGKQKAVRNSQNSFNEFSGKKIRKISIHRINVFGTDINNPGYYNPDRTKRFLNDTHVNTNESVIEKFLLFSEGDTLSPLKLSDNERIIRQLSFIDDARIIVVPVSGGEADIVVVTKDVFSLGGEPDIRSARRGKVSLWEKNIFGMGHEFYFDIPYSSGWKPSPGIGLKYNINNIRKSFINLSLNYYDAIGTKTYGINLTRDLISSTTKYAGGISLNQTFTYLDMYISTRKQDLFFNNQDYWLMRSFLIDRESVTRIILGVR